MMTTTNETAEWDLAELRREATALRCDVRREERVNRALAGRLAAAEKENAELRAIIGRLLRAVPEEALADITPEGAA